MPGHNVPLPIHRYVYVQARGVLGDYGSHVFHRAMWVGISSTPGRMLGCHVLLECGALVADLPIHFLRWKPEKGGIKGGEAIVDVDAGNHGKRSKKAASALPMPFASDLEAPETADLREFQVWDCFGWQIEAVHFPALDVFIHTLNEQKKMVTFGSYWFSVDWIGDGYSQEPEQHKLMHVIATEDGALRLLPTDRILWSDRSFTTGGGVPKIMRQTRVWSVE